MSAPSPDSQISRGRLLRTAGRWAALLVLLLGAGALTTDLLLETIVGTDTLETFVNDRLSRATNGRYHVEVGAVEWSVWNRSVRAEGVVLRSDSTSHRSPDASDKQRSNTQYTARIATLQLEGLHLWPLLRRQAVSVETMTLQRPLLRKLRHGHTSPDEGQDSLVQKQLPPMAIRHLEIRQGTLVARAANADAVPPMPVDSLWGLSLSATGVHIDTTGLHETGRSLWGERVRASADGYRRVSSNRLFAIRLGKMTASSGDSSLVVENVQAHPTVPDAEYMQRHGHRTNRFNASVRRVCLQGIDLRRALSGDALLLRTAVLDSLRVDVYRDNRLPPPHPDPSPSMPHEIAQSQRRPVQIDTIRVANGAVRYAKWDSAAATPGHISFEDIDATIRHVTNRPPDAPSPRPAIIDATTRVAGAGLLTTTIRLPLRSPSLTFSYEGRMGSMDARAFNDTLVPLSGVRITDGQVDNLRFAAQIEDGVAHGTVHGTYRSLKMETVNANKGRRGVGTRLRSFVLDKLMVKSRNPPNDAPPRTGTIEHEYEDGDTFFKFLWHSLRTGLYSLIGL